MSGTIFLLLFVFWTLSLAGAAILGYQVSRQAYTQGYADGLSESQDIDEARLADIEEVLAGLRRDRVDSIALVSEREFAPSPKG